MRVRVITCILACVVLAGPSAKEVRQAVSESPMAHFGGAKGAAISQLHGQAPFKIQLLKPSLDQAWCAGYRAPPAARMRSSSRPQFSPI